MSSPSEPVDTTSISMDLSFLPSRMIEPLPKARSICESAASRAFDFSIGAEPSTTRRAAGLISRSLWLKIRAADTALNHCDWNVHHLFSVRNMFFSGGRYWSLPPLLNFGWVPSQMLLIRPHAGSLNGTLRRGATEMKLVSEYLEQAVK